MTKRVLPILFALTLLVVAAAPASANHWWNGFKWEGTNPALDVESNLDPGWDAILDPVLDDWNVSDVLTLGRVGDDGTDGCSSDDIYGSTPASPGRIEVCNAAYGENGWLGIARVWIAPDGATITAAVAAVNDSYFNGSYDDDNARRHVLCQEIGHTFGLDHQRSPRKQTCMNDQWGIFSANFVSPNGHDYAQLAEIYGTGGGGDGGGDTGGPCAKKPDHPKCQNGAETFDVDHLRGGGMVLTWVTWAPGHGPAH
jgi:hypothetical protein